MTDDDFLLVEAHAEQARRLLGGAMPELVCHPVEYLAPHFNTLRDYYAEAAQRHLAVMTWWD